MAAALDKAHCRKCAHTCYNSLILQSDFGWQAVIDLLCNGTPEYLAAKDESAALHNDEGAVSEPLVAHLLYGQVRRPVEPVPLMDWPRQCSKMMVFRVAHDAACWNVGASI